MFSLSVWARIFARLPALLIALAFGGGRVNSAARLYVARSVCGSCGPFPPLSYHHRSIAIRNIDWVRRTSRRARNAQGGHSCRHLRSFGSPGSLTAHPTF